MISSLKLGIANKIFSLALLLMAFTVTLACKPSQNEVELIATREAPLAASLSKLNEIRPDPPTGDGAEPLRPVPDISTS